MSAVNNQRIGAGFRYIYWGIVNANGFFIGTDTTGPTAGAAAGQPMLRLPGAQTIPVSIPENEIVPVLGDDDPMVSFSFEPGNLPSGVMETALRDDNFEAIIQGTLVESLGDLDVGVMMPIAPARPDVCLLLQRRSKKWESGVKGVRAWEVTFVPRCTVAALGSDLRQREATPFRYSINLSMADRKPWGASFIEAVNGTEGAAMVKVNSDNPLHMHCFVGNNAQTAFTLAYAPVSGAKTYVFVDGYRKTLTTHYTASGSTLTFVSAPGTNAVIDVVYEVDESNLV